MRHEHGVSAVAFSPDGRTVLTGSAVPLRAAFRSRGEARLWDAATGKPLGAPLRQNARISALGFSPDGKTVVTGSPEEGVDVWIVPAPLAGDVERIRLWIEVNTGLELDAGGAVEELDGRTWHERWQRLQDLGGAPQ
jgi:WD40 repeat protein